MSEDVEDTRTRFRIIRPHLPNSVMKKLNAFIETKLNEGIPLSGALRKLNENWSLEAWALELRATALVIADLIDQGWTTLPENTSLRLLPPGMQKNGETPEEAKSRLRQSLQIGQHRQLADPSVQSFIERFSKKNSNNKKKSSVLDLVDDGADLEKKLSAIVKTAPEITLNALKDIIDPVVEVCDEDARCSETGIRLLDIWRYFRHTWSLEYRSIPGRQLPILIRNAARPHRPVIGIALLASPVLRTKPRDNWIGWTPEVFIENLRVGKFPPKKALRALVARVSKSISEIRWDDFAKASEIRRPTEQLILRLEQRGAGAAAKRERQLQDAYTDDIETHGKARSQIDPTRKGAKGINWRKASEDLLFVRKRADTLAKLLDARRFFQTLKWNGTGITILEKLLLSAAGQKALSTALVEMRKAGLASRIADVSVCGAVAPYNVLLGGKLVALAMASKEVSNLWAERYGRQVSIISSQMAGRPIRRSSDLKILTTTSLYGSGSSQYNRLRLSATDYDALKVDIAWKELAKTAGYGTVHLSAATTKALRIIAEKTHKARRINNRFGEGTSPRLRQIREGLDALGIDSDDVLHHATPRLFYACALVPNASEQLLGMRPDKNVYPSPLKAIADAWRKRWLLQRIAHPEVLQKLATLGPETVRQALSIPKDGLELLDKDVF